MELEKISQILTDTSYVKTAGTKEELRCARYLQEQCAALGLESHLEPFPVRYAQVSEERLLADGRSIPCKAYLGCGDADLEAPLFLLTDTSPCSLEQCRGKIVLSEIPVNRWLFQDLLDNGALGFLTFCGDINNPDREIDCRILRDRVCQGQKLPGMIIHAADAVDLIHSGVTTLRMVIQQEELRPNSHNVVVELPGKTEQWIALTAHYDTVSRSIGSYDNMSGCIALLGLMEHFVSHPHRYGLRFIFCGAEEIGLEGSIAYCTRHSEELKKGVLNINVDMIGTIMGKFIACCTTEDRLIHYLQYMAEELGFSITASSGVYPSDSTPFADAGIPSISFARQAPNGTASVHDRYDTPAVLLPERIKYDTDFLIRFADRMANAIHCPVKREIPEKLREKIDHMLQRKKADA